MYLASRSAALSKKVGRLVIFAEQFPFRLFYDRSELLEIPDHQQLYAAERFVPVPVSPQDVVHRIQQVGTHHAYFVDDQQVEASDDGYFFLAEIHSLLSSDPEHARQVRSERKLEERVNGNSSGIDRCDACRRYNNHSFGRALSEIAQESGLSRTGFSREKDIDSGLLEKFPGKIHLGVVRHVLYSFYDLKIPI